METTCVIQKPQKKQKPNGNRKCLGNLPDEVLRHILSFLPMTDAIRTSILSKRWEYLWASIPNLNFAREPANKNLLMDFVERALCLRDSSVIKRFSLSCDVLGDASRIKTWISTAVRRHNVEELYIHLEKIEGFSPLPYCLFTCSTLTNLHLDMSYILKLPTTICLSSLKILSIKRVTFSNEYLTRKLFSGLPVLEGLKLENCRWVNIKFVSISVPKLHSLSIFENMMPEGDFWKSSDCCQVTIVGESLKEFDYDGYLINEYCLPKSSSVEKACIHTSDCEDVLEQIAIHVLNLLIGLSNVEQLKLSSFMNGEFMYDKRLLPHLPMFNNLMDLIIDEPVCLTCPSLVKILQKAHCLRRLVFAAGVTQGNFVDRIWDPMPQCFFSHLKWIIVSNYDEEDEEELFAVKFLLKNAVVLDEIIITSPENYGTNLETKLKFAKQLLELPRGSQNCKIILE